MRWRSTRSPTTVRFVDALFRGQPPDGGLYVPAGPLRIDVAAILRASRSFQDTAFGVARDLLGDDVPAAFLHSAIAEALDFPVPLTRLEEDLHILELFHGPTLAFKDIGARFMAALMDRLDPEPHRVRIVLVATSGDTGSAVAHAFRGRDRFHVVVLFPEAGVSQRQRRLFSTLGGNVTAVGVPGSFDGCQRLVKAAFGHDDAGRLGLTAANSINPGRLLPQTFYYVEALRRLEPAHACAFAVPSGNLGNLTAGVMAAMAGLPVLGFTAALNTNDAFLRYLRTGEHGPRQAHRTLSNAMDVGDPSNLERIRHLTDDDPVRLRRLVRAASFDDTATLDCIARVHRQHGYVLDPHGAVGVLGARAWMEATGGGGPVVALATAHPAKFPEVVEPAIGETVTTPERLTGALAGDERVLPLEPRLDALLALLDRVLGGREART